MTTLEEAMRCPKCSESGEHVVEQNRASKSIRGAKILTIYCRNSRCRWFNTAWTIQVSSNGTIPPAELHRDKLRPLPSWAERDVALLEQQLAAETGRGAEINNPYS